MTGAATATLLDAALDYARRGWPVFPLHTIINGRCTCRKECDSPGKHPKITGGFLHASTVELSIRNWWTRWPDANIGIPTGQASGFFVLDVDPHHGGDDTLRDLEAQHGALPPTVEALTGGGGRHILFRCPGYPVKSSVGALGSGLDTRGDGGYIVAASSHHASGHRYEWEVSSHPDDVAIADAPAWLLDKLRPEMANGNGQGFTVGERIADGERNHTLYRMARSLKAKGLSEPAILAAVRAENTAKCEPPLPEGEIDQIVKHAIAQPDRPEFTATGTSNGGSDPLAPLRALPASPPATDIEAALRMVINSLGGVDGLRRATLRQEALSILKAKEVIGPAKLVDAAWALAGGLTDEGGAQPLTLADPELWPDPVDGAGVLAHLEKAIRRFVILPDHASVAIALWVLHAHALKAFSLSPILAVLSPAMRCGKSTLLHLLTVLLPRALSTSNITASALFRSLEQFKPCILVDEGDSFLTLSEELRGILNSGHTKSGAAVIRTVGESFEPRIFSTWGPKVLAAIGKLPPTVMDRSVVIPMKRKAPDEQVERFRHNKLKDLIPLCRQAARWAADNLPTLQEADPTVPERLNDRAADNWRPLLAIADLAGGDWPTRAEVAALTLSGEAVQEDASTSILLLGDLKEIFKQSDQLPTADIITKLLDLEERPWSTWTRGKPITPRHVAKLLDSFKIRPDVLQPENLRGYKRAQLTDAFTRYLVSDGIYPYDPYKHNENDDLYPNSIRNTDPHDTDTKEVLSIYKQSVITDITDRNPENGQVDADGEVVDPEFDFREPEPGPPVGAWETI